MSAKGAQFGVQAELGEFRCPLSVEISGRCHLFEPALALGLALDDAGLKPRITCRFLLLNNAAPGAEGSRCLLGDSKTRRDHLA